MNASGAAKRVVLLVNPSAGGGRTRRLIDPVRAALTVGGWQVEVHLPASAAALTEVAENAESDSVLAVLGGDGTIAQAARGALRSGAVLAPLPGGRGNDFARRLGIPPDAAKAAEALSDATPVALDVGLAGDRPFLGVATVGVDSVAQDHAARTRIVKGGAVYAWAGTKAFVTTGRFRFEIVVDGEPESFRGWNVSISNSGMYGGGMRIAPGASLTDGRLDVIRVGDVPRWRFPLYLAALRRGTHLYGIRVTERQVAEVVVQGPEGARIYTDGDLAGTVPMTFRVLPAALKVLVPSGPNLS